MKSFILRNLNIIEPISFLSIIGTMIGAILVLIFLPLALTYEGILMQIFSVLCVVTMIIGVLALVGSFIILKVE